MYPDAQILRKDKLHIVVTDGFVQLLGSVQVSLMGHLLRMSLSRRQFPDFSRRNFGNRFLKNSAPTLIQYDVQEFVKWHGIPCTKLDIVLISARTVKVFYIKIKNPEVETGLIPCLHLGDSLYAGNALVKNCSGSAYIKIISTRDTDERIIAPEVELEELDKIAISRFEKFQFS